VAVLPKRRIILVDDDPLIRRIVTSSLTTSGYEIFATDSGREALARARQTSPDLILLDVMMPEMDGYEVCRQLRADPQTTTLPIIMLTAMDESEAVVKGLQIGADDYLIKPFQVNELVSRIEAHLRRSAREFGASPLTTLPGNPAIEQIIQDRLNRHELVAVLYADLTNFKPYNDEYGWLQGDQVIKMLAQRIIAAARLYDSANGFVGHIGGDDFVIVTTPECAKLIAQSVIDNFDASISSFYTKNDRERGYIKVRDRRGKPFRAPVVSVSIGIVTNSQRTFEHVAQVSAWAAEVKKYVKSLSGSHYAFDRRSK
jgi:diguanylate cyclase (GGDEF)-like protein